MTEQWRYILGYKGKYEVSNLGQVRSRLSSGNPKLRPLNGNFKILRPYPTGGGKSPYLTVRLYKDGSTREKKIHIAVLEAFIGPRPNNLIACHNDGDTKNNCLTNLRWDTHKSNMEDRDKHGNWARGSKACRAKLVESEVYEIRELLKTTRSMNSIGIEYGVDVATIRDIRIRKTWKHLP